MVQDKSHSIPVEQKRLVEDGTQSQFVSRYEYNCHFHGNISTVSLLIAHFILHMYATISHKCTIHRFLKLKASMFVPYKNSFASFFSGFQEKMAICDFCLFAFRLSVSFGLYFCNLIKVEAKPSV